MTPAVAGDLVFAGSCSGTYYALDRATGEMRWSYDTMPDGGPAQFHGDPILTDELVVSGSDSGDPPYMYAFDRKDGKVRWKREGTAVESDLMRFGSMAIGRTWNGDLVAVRIESGEVVWKWRPEEYIYETGPDASLTERDGVVYFGGVDGKMYAVSASSGETIWKRDLGARITTAPVAGSDVLFVGAADRTIYRLALEDGKIEKMLSTPGRPHGRPALFEDTFLVLIGRTTLQAISHDLEETRWIQETQDQWTSFQPLVHRGTVVVGSREGDVHAYRIADGEEVWSTQVEGVVRGLGAHEDTIFIGTLKGFLYAYDLKD